MARLVMKVNCGCGHSERLEADVENMFPSKTVKDFLVRAVSHSNHSKHTLEIASEVRYIPQHSGE